MLVDVVVYMCLILFVRVYIVYVCMYLYVYPQECGWVGERVLL